MLEKTHNRWRILWVLPPVALGIFALMMITGDKQPPVRSEQQKTAKPVRTISIPQVALTPLVEGYGAVQPAQVWTAVAQVSGRVVEMNPKLRNGEILPKGTPLLRIDPVDYELNLAQINAELAELEVQEQNTRDSLAIEERNYNLSKRELERLKRLVTSGTTSQSSADDAEGTMLSRRAAAQNLRNTLALIPTQRNLLQARLTQAERDLAHTRIEAPFNLRVANLGIEQDQYVSIGQSLVEGDSVDRIEVIAQVAMSSMRNLFLGQGEIEPDRLYQRDALPQLTGLRPTVLLDMGGHVASWEAEFVRFDDSVDVETRTIGVVVAVDKPLDKIKPGYRPPLSKGMFVQVVLRGRPQPNSLLLPRSAVRDGKVLLVGPDNRLRTQAVKIRFSQGPISVVDSGVVAEQQLVMSDLVPAVDGMLLQPQPDEQLQTQLLRAAGEGR